MPLDIERLLNSKTWRRCEDMPELAFPTMNLWMGAFKAHPAGSLENDDELLARTARLSPARWLHLKADLFKGWVLCSDNRWYHPVVVEKAKSLFNHTTRRKASRELGYAPDFETFWREYEPQKLTPGASKKTAWEAWTRAQGLPAIETLTAAVRAYRASLARKGRDSTPACHPCVWLNQRRWEGFTEAAAVTIRAHTELDARASAAWNGKGAALALLIGPGAFLTWFEGSTLKIDPDQVTIKVPKQTHRDHIRSTFHSQLRRVFGKEVCVELRAGG